MLPLLLLLPLHHGSRNERAENRREKEGEKKGTKREKEGKGWGPNNFLTKPPALSPKICWQTMREVSGIQGGWDAAKKQRGERGKRGGQVGGGRERETERGMEDWSIAPISTAIRSSLATGREWRRDEKDRETEDEHSALHSQRPWRPPPRLSTCTSPPSPHLSSIILLFSTSPPFLYLLSLLASPSLSSH